MKLLRSLLWIVVLLVAVSAMAIEPSSSIVVVGGKKYYVHTIEQGHTLYSLAKAYNVTVDDIVACNEGLSAETLKLDQKIYIPVVETPKRELRRAKSDEPTDAEKEFTIHTVRAGDTLYSIAKRYKVSLSVVEADNPEATAPLLSIGDTLRIRNSEMGLATSRQIEREQKSRESLLDMSKASSAEGHEVQPGETVYSLSRRYGMSEGEFLAINGLTTAADLRVGMRVRVEREVPREEATQSETTTPHEIKSIDGALSDVAVPLCDTLAGHDEAYAYMFGDEAYIDSVRVQQVDVDFLRLGNNNTLKAVLMMPFHMQGKINPSFVDFYKGLLLGMEDLKKEGMSIELSVFDTENSASRIKELVDYEDALLDAQIIFGPVYEEELRHVLGHAEDNHIPVITPFDDVDGIVSPVLFQMQPRAKYKNDKLAELVADPREIIFVYASTNDDAFRGEVTSLMTSEQTMSLNALLDRELTFRRRNSDGTNGEVVNLMSLLRTKTEKTFVILASKESDVSRLLAALSSAKIYNSDRGLTMGDYVVIGNRKWMRKGTIDRQSFFKNDVAFVVSHHAKRDNDTIRLFDARYIKAYHTLPSMFSYRGYEAAMIFCRRMFSGFDTDFYEQSIMPLTTPYHFIREDGINVNREWLLEHYRSNFIIQVK